MKYTGNEETAFAMARILEAVADAIRHAVIETASPEGMPDDEQLNATVRQVIGMMATNDGLEDMSLDFEAADGTQVRLTITAEILN